MSTPPSPPAVLDLDDEEDRGGSFLRQIKRSASRAMEDRAPPNALLTRSKSGPLGGELTDEDDGIEEIEMINNPQTPLSVREMNDLLQAQYAIIPGGKSKDGCPIIIFPDNNNFQLLSDPEYQQLMIYLTAVPSLQEADLGFHLIVDRRKDRWNSVKAVLLKISAFFPGLVHMVYILRPASFFQKAISEVSNKFFRDVFKFPTIVLSTVEELHEYIDISQLTVDLGGILSYCHEYWIEERNALEEFSTNTYKVSHALDAFTKRINETEFPNNVDSTKHLLETQTMTYSELKEEILSAAKHGETLLNSIRENSNRNLQSLDSDQRSNILVIGNVFMVERLLVQLEETERQFDAFWQHYSTELRHCLALRRFEQDFRELQANFTLQRKTISEMIELGDTVGRIDTLIKQTAVFQKYCQTDIDRAEEVIASGEQLLKIKSSFPHDSVEPKCKELASMCAEIHEKLIKRMDTLLECRNLIERIGKVNVWCIKGQELAFAASAAENQIDLKEAEKSFLSIREFLKSTEEIQSKEFRSGLQNALCTETSPLVTQVLQKIDDTFMMLENCTQSLKKIGIGDKSFSGSEKIMSNQSTVHKIGPIQKLKSEEEDSTVSTPVDRQSTHEEDPAECEARRAKRGHVLSELLETERVYVSELLTILKGYKYEALSAEMQPILPPGLIDKLDILFGNLDDIYNFHADIFLKDMENCICSTDLVALCFVQKRDVFYHLYSYYCQNIPRSEQLRETIVDTNGFFQICQKKLEHKLPLAAYLLKPVQRITKYQLLLKDLLRYSDEGNCTKELQLALDCMLVVLRCVNDSMHQISISGFPVDLSQHGDLLLQGSFSVWTESKRDLRLRIKPTQRQIFLYQKALIFCKSAGKSAHNKASYHFKHRLQMSQVGLTESVKGDGRKFEVWLQGRQEVHTIQAASIEQKQLWVGEIKRVLMNQLEELKGEKIRQYSALAHNHKPLRQTTSWETQKMPIAALGNQRTISCESEPASPMPHIADDAVECVEGEQWSSEGGSSDEEEQTNPIPSGRYVALADYCAVGTSEVNMRDGDTVELMKVGCAGWWFVKVIGTGNEGWAPAAYLDNLHRRTSRSSSRSQDRLSDH